MTRVLAAVVAAALTAPLLAQDPPAPRVGQPGKDVVWVPTPPELVEKMLDLAKVTPGDVVYDLGSGDGRNVIAAAKRGARAVGVEFNHDLVLLSSKLAREAGVAERATFVEGDMYEADVSSATVFALYLLPVNMNKLEPKLYGLKPGVRIVANTFAFDEWDPDVRLAGEGTSCASWCEALLWVVPAKVSGTWIVPEGTLTFEQAYQMLSGRLATKSGAVEIANARVRGDEVHFVAGGLAYSGHVTGDAIDGMVITPSGSRPWRATRR